LKGRHHPVKITFQPEGKIAQVDKGTSLLEAAAQAGVYINSVCRGDGISRRITYYDLITHSNYMDEFMSAKFLPHTDLNKFPRSGVKTKNGRQRK